MAKINTLFPWPIVSKVFRVDHVDRIDRIGAIVEDGMEGEWFKDYSDSMKKHDYKALQKTDEGYLVGRAVATTIGVFPYLQADGSIRRELRSPEEVYNPDSLESLKLAEITNNHPTEAVTTDNVNKYGVGTVGENVVADTLHGFVSVPVAIKERQAVEDVEGGKRGLSCGYTCDVVDQKGTWGGIQYDAIQKNIRYNHLAIVDEGRAGDDAILKMDGAMILDQSEIKTNKQPNNQTGGKMKIKLDGINCEADERVIDHLNAASDRADTAESDKQKADEALEAANVTIEEMQAKLDVKTSEAEELQSKLDNSIPLDQLDEKIAAIKKMDEAVALSGAELKGDESELDQKKAVIMAFDSKADLEGRTDAYIESYFDIKVEEMKKLDEKDSKNAEDLKGDSNPEPQPKVDAAPVLTPEQKLDNKIANKWRAE